MKFEVCDGMIKRSDYAKVVSSVNAINNCIFLPAMHSQIINGQSYVSLDFIKEWSDTKRALETVAAAYGKRVIFVE